VVQTYTMLYVYYIQLNGRGSNVYHVVRLL